MTRLEQLGDWLLSCHGRELLATFDAIIEEERMESERQSPKKEYRGRRDPAIGALVTVTTNGESEMLPLRPSLEFRKHSPTGFEWGYAGSGPSQLALAILLDYYGPGRSALALKYYQDFKDSVIAAMKGDQWVIDDETIDDAIDFIENGAA